MKDDGRAQVFHRRMAHFYPIVDRGEGVLPADRAAIFEPFVTKRVRGTGLGLALSRRIVQLHGGTVEVDDHPEGGARFRVRIPGSDR